MKTPKITYKNSPKPKGLASVGAAEIVYAKIKKQHFANLRIDFRYGASIQVCVKKEPTDQSNPNTDWKWIYLDVTNVQTMDEAKAQLEKSLPSILEKHTLHFLDN